MTEQRDILVAQISRGLSPAISISATIAACTQRGLNYKLIVGKPAPEAKNEAAQAAWESNRDLILCEDDFLAESKVWDAATADTDQVLVGSALMRNGEINVWFLGERLVYSGTVFVKIPWTALDAIGDPWFSPRDLNFNGQDGGEWRDDGPNADGFHSDTWFYYRCWTEGIEPKVCGFVTHLIHPGNNALRQLNQPDQIKPLGLMNCTKIVS